MFERVPDRLGQAFLSCTGLRADSAAIEGESSMSIMRDIKSQKLIFIYNADSGLGNMLLDGAHKILSPGTYNCKLCELTFGAFTEKNVWKKFRTESGLPMEFLHKDEFKKQYASKFGHTYTFPIVLVEGETGLEVFITTEEMNRLGNAEELIGLITSRV